MFLLTGVARYLFVPLAEAVIFAMLASYLLSRTLVSTLAKYWLSTPHENQRENTDNFIIRGQKKFEHHFENLRENYRHTLKFVLEKPKVFVGFFLGFLVISFIILFPWVGSDFFPDIDSGQIKLHIHGPAGLRVEETARLVSNIDNYIRQKIPNKELTTIVDNIGLPVSGINLTYSNSLPVGPADADILVSLKPGYKTTDYIRDLRKELPAKFPGISFAFLPADMATQILNFGLPAPVLIYRCVGSNNLQINSTLR